MKRLFYLGIAVLFLVFGLTAYRQSEKAKIYRDERNKIHQKMIEVRREAQSAKLEVAKLKQIIDMERRNAQEMIRKATEKK
jgi:hypothetical protein